MISTSIMEITAMNRARDHEQGTGRPIAAAPREVFLAGLGVLERAAEEGEDRFRRLVEQGRQAEARLRDSLGTLAPGVTGEVREPAIAYGEALHAPSVPLPALIDALTPAAVPTPAAVLQARRNAAARSALVEELGLLTSGDVADLNESTAGNRAALASRWKREGRIFSVRHHGNDYFPAFQLDGEHRPREIVGRVLRALGGAGGWETALWFVAANGYLEGRRPVDLLESDPDAVVQAAEREAAEIVF